MDSATVIGIDLAWGEKNPDGVTILTFPHGIDAPPKTIRTELVFGDNQLLRWISEVEDPATTLIAVDAPTICLETTGTRKADKACSAEFRAAEAGCHPVNRSLCDRPFRVAERLEKAGYRLTSDPTAASKTVCEVFPHPATIRFFGLEKTIKYKKGTIKERSKEFRRFQDHLRSYLAREMPIVLTSEEHLELLHRPWGKTCEDLLDSLLCALIGHHHLRYGGARSQVFGDDIEGHIVVPAKETEQP